MFSPCDYPAIYSYHHAATNGVAVRLQVFVAGMQVFVAFLIYIRFNPIATDTLNLQSHLRHVA